MKPELPYKALRLYGNVFGVVDYSPNYISYSFIPMFKKMGYVWIHTSSILRYCHLTKPDEFGYLSRADLINITNGQQMMNDGRRNTRMFRSLTINEFEQGTGLKV